MVQCEECKREFDSQEGFEQHKKDKHSLADVRKSPGSGRAKYAALGAVAVLIIGVGVFVMFSQPQITGSSTIKYSKDIPKTGIHWHPKLYITINGQGVTIPGGVGLTGAHQPVHTHDSDNVLHYEFDSAPTYEQMRLGNFFRIWGKRFSSTCILDSCNEGNTTVKMYVNGAENTEYDNYIPSDLDRIEIKYE